MCVLEKGVGYGGWMGFDKKTISIAMVLIATERRGRYVE